MVKSRKPMCRSAAIRLGRSRIEPEEIAMTVEKILEGLRWLGHDSFQLEGPPLTFFDPWKLKGVLPKADLVLVSHEHFDHCSPDDVDKLRGPQTVILAAPLAAGKLEGARAVRPGETVHACGIDIQAVPAYNLNKFRAPGQVFHPDSAGHVGWILDIGGVRVYHAGDSDLIPEMKGLQVDIALLPVSGTYVMTIDEAIEAAKLISPQVVVPMHYGDIVGSDNDGALFAAGYPGRTVVLQPE